MVEVLVVVTVVMGVVIIEVPYSDAGDGGGVGCSNGDVDSGDIGCNDGGGGGAGGTDVVWGWGSDSGGNDRSAGSNGDVMLEVLAVAMLVMGW